MIADLKHLESELLSLVKAKLLNECGKLVNEQIWLMEEAPIDAGFPFYLIQDGGVSWPTPDRQGQKQIIPDLYVDIIAFQERWYGEEPIVSDSKTLGLTEMIGEALSALYKKDLGNKYHYAVPVQTSRSEFYRQEGMEMDRIAKFKSLRMLYRKYVNLAL